MSVKCNNETIVWRLYSKMRTYDNVVDGICLALLCLVRTMVLDTVDAEYERFLERPRSEVPSELLVPALHTPTRTIEVRSRHIA